MPNNGQTQMQHHAIQMDLLLNLPHKYKIDANRVYRAFSIFAVTISHPPRMVDYVHILPVDDRRVRDGLTFPWPTYQHYRWPKDIVIVVE